MAQAFIEFLSEYIELSRKEITLISNHLDVQTFEKGTILLAEGDIAQQSYFVLEGCVCSYYLVDGVVTVTEFFTEKDPVTPASYTTKQPSEYFLKCLENTHLAVATVESTEELINKVPRLAPLGKSMLDDMLNHQRRKYDDFIKLTPEQRYHNLQQQSPGLLNRVPQYLVASYLGIKPESLSRIRNRIHKNQP